MFGAIGGLSLILVGASCGFGQQDGDGMTDRERALLDRIAKLEERLAALESKLAGVPAPAPGAPLSATPSSVQSQVSSPAPEVPQPKVEGDSRRPEWLRDTTVSAYFDGYYLWNTNRPPGRVNPLRAYDVTANSFSINQTGLVVERTPALDAGRRWGYRLDLMLGQATQALQGSALNEPRPQVYRSLFQAYGTYVVPLGKGLTVDFGKWASALGFENNYTKDQINYSRSYLFAFLPAYHTGLRTSYNASGKVGFGYWLVNGANQTEDFNGSKSHVAQLILNPAKTLSWTVQYYTGRERGGQVPRGNDRLHIVDTYGTWSPASKLVLGAEMDYVINRVEKVAPPRRVVGGAAYLKYALTPRFYFGQRYVRLNDRAGLFSGAVRNLNDVTSTFAFRPVEGFETRLEFRRDFSNTPFFPASQPGHLKKEQNTITLGLLWWFGEKQGAW